MVNKMIHFEQTADCKSINDIKKLNEKIKKEPDTYRKMKLYEQTMLCQLFSNEFGGNARFRNPW